MKHYRKIQKNIEKKINFSDYLKHNFIKVRCSSFIYGLMRAIDSVAPVKKIRVKANFKPWFDPEAISAIQNEANYIQDSEIQAQKQTKKNHNLKNISSKGATQT